MKYLVVMCLFLLTFSCKSSSKTFEYEKQLATSHCPDDGVCTFEIQKNKLLEIKKDEFGNTYPEITFGSKSLAVFEFKRNEIPNTADSGYRELVYLELDPEVRSLTIEGEELSKVKLLYARLCFCRGETGYYKITDGSLSLEQIDKKTFKLRLSFNNNVVPQLIKTIEEVFIIN